MYTRIKRNTLKRTLIVSACLLGVAFTGCQNSDNDIWDKDPIVRLEEAKTQLKDALVNSENGWIVNFSPDGNNLMGEFNVWMKFEDDFDVEIKTDLHLNELEGEKTQFNFTLLHSVALNFPHGNKIHDFTAINPNNLKTDIEFVLDSYLDDNTIQFIGHTTKQKIVFRKATAEEKAFRFDNQWNTYTQLKSMKTVVYQEPGQRAQNFTYFPLLNDDDWRACQILRGEDPVGILTFKANKEGTIVTLGEPFEFDDGSTITELVKSNNTFVGASETGGVLLLR